MISHTDLYIYLDPISINLHYLINFSSSLFSQSEKVRGNPQFECTFEIDIHFDFIYYLNISIA